MTFCSLQIATMAGFSSRPFKVWNADRSIKKSLIASSLAELLDKGGSQAEVCVCVCVCVCVYFVQVYQ